MRNPYAVIHFSRKSVVEDLFSLEEVADSAGCHPRMVEQFVRFGVIEAARPGAPETMGFTFAALRRLRRGLRLRRDLGVPVSAMPLVLDLLERIDDLETEVRRLKDRDIF